MIDVLFVNPPTPSPAEHSGYSQMSPPLGIGYVAASLREAGFSVAAVDLALAENPDEELRQAINIHQPRICGFYTLTQNYYATEGYLDLVRNMDSDLITWVGGPHVSYEYETALKESGFDVVFFFEAEHSAVEVAQFQINGKGSLYDVAGIAFMQCGDVVRTKPRTRERALDNLPFPARDLFPMHLYKRPGTIMTSRGCPLKCIFCIASTFEDAYRYRSPEDVVDELKYVYDNWGVTDYYFIDNVFTTHRGRAREVCRLLRKAALPIGWYCVSRVDYVSPELMQELASAGCYRIELGVESASVDVIDTMRKHIKIDQVYRAADIIMNLGMQPMFTFQVGHPDDTLETIEATLTMIETLRERGAGTYLSITTPFPGTPLYMNRDEYGVTMETTNWEDFRLSNPTYSTNNFCSNDLRQAVYRESVNITRAVAEGRVNDPPLAPWIRFASSGKSTPLPPPPTESQRDPSLEIDLRAPNAAGPSRGLPVIQMT